MVISARFERVWGFHDNGLALAQVDGKWGFINEIGDMEIPARFDSAGGFGENGLAKVELDNKWGLIDESGKIVIPIQFDEILFSIGNAVAPAERDGKWGLINENGSEVAELLFDVVVSRNDYFTASFGDKRFPILSDGTFLGFTRADVIAEYDRIAQNKRREEERRRAEEERRRLAECDHVYVGKEWTIEGRFGFKNVFTVLSVSPRNGRAVIYNQIVGSRKDVSCREVP